MNKGRRYSPEVRERAVRLLFEHEKEYESRWAATVSIASTVSVGGDKDTGWAREKTQPRNRGTRRDGAARY